MRVPLPLHRFCCCPSWTVRLAVIPHPLFPVGFTVAIAIERFVRTLTVHVVIAPPPSRVGDTSLLDDVRHRFVGSFCAVFCCVGFRVCLCLIRCCFVQLLRSFFCCCVRIDCCFVIAPVVVFIARSRSAVIPVCSSPPFDEDSFS